MPPKNLREVPSTEALLSLEDMPLRAKATIVRVGGERAFRRRLMELGLIPGTEISVENIAPMGDPLELSVRGCRLSIRRRQARAVWVTRS